MLELTKHLGQLCAQAGLPVRTAADSPDIADNEFCVGAFQVCVSHMPPVGVRAAAARLQACNPVTLTPRGVDQPCLTLSRLHLRHGRTHTQLKHVTVMMYEAGATASDVRGLAVFDEDHVVDALRSLFPHGELAGEGRQQAWPARTVTWQTSDHKTWESFTAAELHQARLGPDGQPGKASWLLVTTPAGQATVVDCPEEAAAETIRKGFQAVPGYACYLGFATREDAVAFGARKQLVVD
jgi:hypothetical protein